MGVQPEPEQPEENIGKQVEGGANQEPWFNQLTNLEYEEKLKEFLPITAETAGPVANCHMLVNYIFGLLGGHPHRLALPDAQWWVVPMLLTSPGYGVVGQVGVLAIDEATGNVVGGTPKPEVISAVKQLQETHNDALEAAFLKARKA
jgi:hypothetical protein